MSELPLWEPFGALIDALEHRYGRGPRTVLRWITLMESEAERRPLACRRRIARCQLLNERVPEIVVARIEHTLV
jgi:hypothetical protein